MKDLKPIVHAAQAAQESLVMTALALTEGKESTLPILCEITGLQMKILRRTVLRMHKRGALAKTGNTKGVRYGFEIKK